MISNGQWTTGRLGATEGAVCGIGGAFYFPNGSERVAPGFAAASRWCHLIVGRTTACFGPYAGLRLASVSAKQSQKIAAHHLIALFFGQAVKPRIRDRLSKRHVFQRRTEIRAPKAAYRAEPGEQDIDERCRRIVRMGVRWLSLTA